ncbi:hypothetical protein [Agarivorans sp. Toyoura001]|uniref:hypothetical protein n=1 Tax=unclassified Agarivorans TaxID=2636026 RepID=UPI0010D58934|nr:hypothetical protein [Agarivorans sp. Toyoura001]GDY27585.1 hypothetical protein AHAT_34750 [Agarivorans sp. Toyoura001]
MTVFPLLVSSTYTQTAKQYMRCVVGGNWLMLLSLSIIISSIVISYPLAQSFSIPMQITAHISTIVFAGILKVGYVLRCVGLNELGQEVL